ncbi:MAG: hypothetical protein ACE5JK_03580 [Candidatus Omnitrophota bacterium]
MKKAVAILLVFVFVVGCTVAFTAPMDADKLKATPRAKGEKRLEVKFWDDLVDLITKKIPDTFEQKSSKHPYEPKTK